MRARQAALLVVVLGTPSLAQETAAPMSAKETDLSAKDAVREIGR